MTSTAVVTGSAARVADVARAIESRGVCVLPMARDEDLGRLGSALAPGSVDYYVQLPDDVASPGSTKAGALAALFGRGLMRRFDEVEVVLAKLAPGCAVVLVTGETVEDLCSVDYPHAPTCVLEMLAEAIVVDMAPSPVRAMVASHLQSADQIAELLLVCGPDRTSQVAGFAARSPEMRFDDWRLACLSPTGPEA